MRIKTARDSACCRLVRRRGSARIAGIPMPFPPTSRAISFFSIPICEQCRPNYCGVHSVLYAPIATGHDPFKLHAGDRCYSAGDSNYPDRIHTGRRPDRPQLVATLAHPGGNITGFSNLEPSFAGKWLQLLADCARCQKMGSGRSARTIYRLLGSNQRRQPVADVSRAQHIEQVIRTYFQACKDADVKPCCLVVN